MDIKLTSKAGGIPLADFLSQGWTPALLVEHGYAEPIAAAKPAPTSDKWRTVATYGARPEDERPIAPNIFGVQDVATVKNFWRECAAINLYPHGYSFEQQLIFVAEKLHNANPK